MKGGAVITMEWVINIYRRSVSSISDRRVISDLCKKKKKRENPSRVQSMGKELVWGRDAYEKMMGVVCVYGSTIHSSQLLFLSPKDV